VSQEAKKHLNVAKSAFIRRANSKQKSTQGKARAIRKNCRAEKRKINKCVF